MTFSAYRWSVQACSIFLGLLFWTAGMSKLYHQHAFIGVMGPQWLIEKLAEFQLGFYASFIAYCQVVIGLMLLTLRFRLAGAVFLVPMLANILMITISQNWRGTPYIVSIFIAMNLWVLWIDRQKILLFLGYVPQTIPAQNTPIQKQLPADALWLLGVLANIISIQFSFIALPFAYTLAVLGVIISFGAYQWHQKLTK